MMLSTVCALLLACGQPAPAVGPEFVDALQPAVGVLTSRLPARRVQPSISSLRGAETTLFERVSFDQDDDKKPPTPPHTGIRALASGLVDDVKHLPSKPNGIPRAPWRWPGGSRSIRSTTT